ncbi:hypothetical protein COT47_03245 [Candidatus Woesearchaeota archaeon CG08_land_8_20_14_0_20_43_7]|nr:MAG: hypothetical protein COT47_03245 [Candidatus Woesearchaeota archaeon CG08_land_8_20_14_0_20_43_7]
MRFDKLAKVLALLSPLAFGACQPEPASIPDIKIQGTTEKVDYRPGETVRFLKKDTDTSAIVQSLMENMPTISRSDNFNRSYTIRTQGRTFTPDGKNLMSTELREILLKSAEPQKHVMLQYTGNLSLAEQQELKDKGIKIKEAVASKTYLASVPTRTDLESILDTSQHRARFVGEWKVGDKSSPLDAKNSGYTSGIHILLHKDTDIETVKSSIEAEGGMIINSLPKARSLVVRSKDDSQNGDVMLAKKIAKFDSVFMLGQAVPMQGIESVLTSKGPRYRAMENNLFAREFGKITDLNKTVPGLDGTGVTALVYDAGHVDDTHQDLKGRVSFSDDVTYPQYSDHPTHVACSVAGDGAGSEDFLEENCGYVLADIGWNASDFKNICKEFRSDTEKSFKAIFRGVAPNAKIISEDHGNCTKYCVVENPNQMVSRFLGAKEKGASAGGASIGPNVRWNHFDCSLLGMYDSVATAMDFLVSGEFGNKPMHVQFSAGNERYRNETDPYCFKKGIDYGYYSIGGGPASAKNVFAIGAMMADEDGRLVVASYTSFGPLDGSNGRVKPTLVHYGGGTNQGILSCTNGGGYEAMAGTSMSQPLVLGTTLLIVQDYRDLMKRSDSEPSPQLIHAILVDSADDVGPKYVDFQTGFGMINALKAHEIIKNERFSEDTLTDTSTIHSQFFNVTDKRDIEVTLAYLDHPGKYLINDLDITLVSPSGTIYSPHVLDPANPTKRAKRYVDHQNNIEKITIDSLAEKEEGIWEVRVNAYDLVTGSQPYALAFSHNLFKPKQSYILRADTDGNHIKVTLKGDLVWKKCPECLPKAMPDMIPPTPVDIGPGERISFADALKDFIPKETGQYEFDLKVYDMYGMIHVNPDGDTAEHKAWFIVREDPNSTKLPK